MSLFEIKRELQCAFPNNVLVINQMKRKENIAFNCKSTFIDEGTFTGAVPFPLKFVPFFICLFIPIVCVCVYFNAQKKMPKQSHSVQFVDFSCYKFEIAYISIDTISNQLLRVNVFNSDFIWACICVCLCLCMHACL